MKNIHVIRDETIYYFPKIDENFEESNKDLIIDSAENANCDLNKKATTLTTSEQKELIIEDEIDLNDSTDSTTSTASTDDSLAFDIENDKSQDEENSEGEHSWFGNLGLDDNLQENDKEMLNALSEVSLADVAEEDSHNSSSNDFSMPSNVSIANDDDDEEDRLDDHLDIDKARAKMHVKNIFKKHLSGDLL